MARDRQALQDGAAHQKKLLDMHKDVRQGRFSSVEVVLAIIAAAFIIGLLAYSAGKFTTDARKAVNTANAHNLYIAVYAALSLESFPPEDIEAFKRKYASYTPIEELSAGESPVEKSVVSRLQAYASPEQAYDDTENPARVKGYIKLEVSDTGEIAMLYCKNAEGRGEIRFPN